MTYIIKNNGAVIDLDKKRIRTLDLVIGSPNITNNLQFLAGRNQPIDYGRTYSQREIALRLKIIGYDNIDFSLLRNEIFEIFSDQEPFYLIEKRLPSRRWLVTLKDDFNIKQKNVYGKFEIKLICLSNFAESTYTTLDLHNNKFNSETEIFGYADGINDEMQDYIFKTNIFSLWNAGNVTVEPETMFLKIQLRDCISNGNLTIRNKTTGETFVYFPKIDYTRHYTLEGMTFLSANTNALRDTNLEFISLAPGKNDFEILNCTFSAVTFDFRFYYK